MPEIIEGLVSTIIPVYNRPEMLRDAVESVLLQTYRPIEIIICDDGSTDGAQKTADQLATCYPDEVRVIHQVNQGAGVAREAGRQAARGEFIQYLDSDDLLLPRKFEIMVAALRNNPDCGAAYGYIRLRLGTNPPQSEPYKWSGRKMETLFPRILMDRWWNTDCPLFRRSVCDDVGAWTNLRYSQDWEYDARVGALGTKLVHCEEFVCEQRNHAGPRQTDGGRWLTPSDQVLFFQSLYACALKAGVSPTSSEMRHFVRWVFAAARAAGKAGEFSSAKQLLGLARKSHIGISAEMSTYRCVVGLLGWKAVANMTDFLLRVFGRKVGRNTQRQSWMMDVNDYD